MFSYDKKIVAIGAGFIVLAAVAIAGWMHGNTVPASASPNSALANNVGFANTPVGYNTSATVAGEPSASAAPAPAVEPDYGPGLSNDGYYADIDRPVYVRQAAPPPPQPVVARYAAPAYYESSRDERRHHHHRSFAKSVAIVAGSAGAGAAIGAIAGGAPGAAIGAVAGGTGGFIYDRSTAHHR